jgi:putative photosynthetic complex assembly protein
MSAAHHHHKGPFPRGALIMAAALIGTVLVAATAVRTGLIPVQASPVDYRAEHKIAAIVSRDLRFSDRADGAVVIEDVSNGQIARTIEPGKRTGFVRGIMRSLARERKMKGIGAEAPFRLTAWADGEISLVDSATGRAIELNAFGTDNRAEFAALLPPIRKAM